MFQKEKFNIKNDKHKLSFHLFFINMKENINWFNSNAFYHLQHKFL